MESTNGFSVEYWGRLGLPNRDVGAPKVQPQGQASAGCLTLPTDSAERKKYPLLRGLLNYFPAALARVSRISYEGNEKHNPGQPLHHARPKSTDHGDCILRHTVDLEELKARVDSGWGDNAVTREAMLNEAACRAWRALAELQELEEQYRGAPIAPAAKYE